VKKDILRLGLALAIFAVGACVSLAFVYAVTGPTIAGLEKAQLDAALKDLFPGADAFAPIEPGLVASDSSVMFPGAWQATAGEAVIGVAIKGNGKSYGGAAVMLIGVSADKRIVGARVLTLADTPGLGANALSPTYFVDKSSKTTFPGQFTGKPVTDPFEVKNDVIAISASTITSKALTKIVKLAGEAGSTWLAEHATGGSL